MLYPYLYKWKSEVETNVIYTWTVNVLNKKVNIKKWKIKFDFQLNVIIAAYKKGKTPEFKFAIFMLRMFSE